MKSSSNELQYYPAIDGLRGLAIILVLFYHNFYYYNISAAGQFGVDLFFVLSGFLITSILLKSRGLPGYFTNFYIRRILRIFPIYYLCLSLLFFVSPNLSWPDKIIDVAAGDQWWFWGYMQNWYFALHPVKPGEIPLTHFWSLAAEEQFYIIWPLVILFSRSTKSLFSICVISLVLVNITRVLLWISLEPGISDNAFIMTRFDGILTGSALAVYIYRAPNNNSWLLKRAFLFFLILNIFYAFICFFSTTRPPYFSIAGYTGVSFFSAWVIFVNLSHNKSLFYKFLISRSLKIFGKYSYGIYVFHFPVMYLLHPYTEKWLWPLTGSRIPETLILIFAELLTAVIVYHLYEKHFLRLKKFFRHP